MENHYFMKYTIPKIYLDQIYPLTILILVSLIVWFGGPFLTIANTTPLQQHEARFLVIVALSMIWLIKFLFFDVESDKSTSNQPSAEIAKKIQILEGRFQGAIDFLQKTTINKQGKDISLAKLPWFLMIGTLGSGKTTLLANSHANFILAKQFKDKNIKNIPLSSHSDWWATRDLVFVDVPGNYISSREKQLTAGNVLWNKMLELIKKNSAANLSGVIIALQLPELIKKHNSEQRKHIFIDIKKHITQLRENFGNQIPFYLTITKCDLLPGFVEFFSDCGTDEQTQAWGVTLPLLNEKERIHEVFAHRFNALIKRLNKQLLWRLHQERNPIARPYIKDFPLQVERLKDAIIYFLKALNMPNLCLHGVYLTSAIQSTEENSHSQTPVIINPAASQALQLARHPDLGSRAFFIKQFIQHGLLNTPDPAANAKYSKEMFNKKLAYASAVGVIAISAVLLGQDFQKSLQQVYSLQNDLTQYQTTIQQANQQDNQLSKALPLLNALREAAKNANHPISKLMSVLSFYSIKSQQTAGAIYTQALQTIVLPKIKSDLEKYLQDPNNKNPQHLYTALKAYLMLGDAQNLDVDFAIKTFNAIVLNNASEQTIEELNNHIRSVFVNQWKPAELNSYLIAQVRKELTSLPATELGFVILKSNDINSQINVVSLGSNIGNPPVFTNKQTINQIPSMYTATQFENIASQQLQNIALETLQGNWVLGNAAVAPSQTTLAAVTEQLRTKYIANYIDTWESVLSNLQIYIPKNLTQMNAMVGNLTSSTSPLLQLLQLVQQNTSFTPILNASPQLQTLNSLLANNVGAQQNGGLYPVFISLRQLDSYLQNIISTPDTGKTAYQVTKNTMLNPSAGPIPQLRTIAAQSPEPLKNWLNTIADLSLKLVIEDTVNYIDTAWQASIGSTFHEHFAGRYPFTPGAKEEVEIQHFVNLLGQPGTLMSFYQNFLKPFVNDTDKKWTWRMVDNQRLPFSDSLLEKIQLAMQIQHAFFPNGDNKLYVQFALEPVNLDANAKSFNLNINGQQIAYQNQHVPRTVSWPGTNAMHSTTLNFISPDNQIKSNELKGDWGWFRLVTQSARQIVTPKQLLLEFNVEGTTAKYMLFTQGKVNPFVGLDLTHFELPEKLV